MTPKPVIRNYKIVLEYDGYDFYGWQSQDGKRTVCGVLEDSLRKVVEPSSPIQIVAAGRTDRGVHAVCQVVSVKIKVSIPIDKLGLVLNNLLPKDVRIKKVEVVGDDFSARFSAKAREYTYILSVEDEIPLELRKYIGVIERKKNLSINLMRKAARLLIGENYLKTFCSAGSDEVSYYRNIHLIKIYKSVCIGVKGEKSRTIRIIIRANAFLYQMVRNIVSCLVEVGAGCLSITEFREILGKGDRRLIGKSAPTCGLYLSKVVY